MDRVGVDAAEQLAVAHDPREHDHDLLCHRLPHLVLAQATLESDDIGRLDVADRCPAKARNQVAIEAGRVDLRVLGLTLTST